MKAIVVMFDSLNGHMLPPYGGTLVKAPNFERLASRSVTFDKSFVGSMPCMPARRDFHTGRYNFLHRSWGPLEPFDDSMPEMLKQNGIYTHLVTDHQHYFEDGGASYHTRYSSWEFFRGQEGDLWKGQVAEPEIPHAIQPHNRPMWRQDWINRSHMPTEQDQPQTRTFDAGLDFMRTNAADDNWFLQIETFDPHEPFFTQQRYKDLYPHDYDGPHFDWPAYAPANESSETIEHVRREYAALVSMCDHSLGRVLDLMDELDLWKDTMLIVCTDHGFLLGEHGYWAKNYMPWYNEIANTPLFVWDPRTGQCGDRSDALVQFIDFAPTLLDFFGLEPSPNMIGKTLPALMRDDQAGRQAVLFGSFGAHVNATDGRYVYMRAPASAANGPAFEYTLMPTRIWGHFSIDDLALATLAPPLAFTKGVPTLRVPWTARFPLEELRTMLFDTELDPKQTNPLDSDDAEQRMATLMQELMAGADAPPEQYSRLGFEIPVSKNG